MSDQMNPMGPAEPEIMSQDAEDVIGLQPGQSDREGAMAKADLYKIANYSHKLFKQINDEDQMEAWVQAKITKAADYIASVYHYLEYEMKFSQYGQALEDSEVYSESQKQAIKNRLMEAKEKVKELKVKQAKKAKDDAADKVSEGVLSGGHKSCTECGGSGMVYEEPKAIPAHVKGKVEKYNRQAKAFHAASKRIDRNNDGIDDRLQSPDVDENLVPVPNPSGAKSAEDAKKLGAMMPAKAGEKDPIGAKEGFGETDKDELKVGQKKKTRTGELERVSDTTTRHTNTSYKDDGDEIAANARSGKGKASHAKAQSAAEKKDRAPAQKQSPKSAKTWGMKDSEKFDNRDGAPAKPKKEKEVGEGVYEAKKKGDGNLANNAKPYDKVTRGDVIAGRLGKDAKGGKDKKTENVVGNIVKGAVNLLKKPAKTTAEKNAAQQAADKGKNMPSSGNAADDYDYFTGRDKVLGGEKKVDEAGKVKEAKEEKFDALKHVKNPTKGEKEAAKDVKRGSYADRAAMLKSAEADGRLKEAAKQNWNNVKETQAYIAEKKAKTDWDKDGKKESEQEEHAGVVDNAIKANKKEVVKESADLTRIKQFLTRLNG